MNPANEPTQPQNNDIDVLITLSQRVFTSEEPTCTELVDLKKDAQKKFDDYGEYNNEALKTYSNVAELYLRNNKYNDALNLFELCYEKYQTSNISEKVAYLVSIANIQTILCNFEKAERSLAEGLAILEHNHANYENSLTLIEIYKAKIRIYIQQARYRDALQYVEKCKQIPKYEEENERAFENKIELLLFEAKICGLEAEIKKMKTLVETAINDLKNKSQEILLGRKYAEFWSTIGFSYRIQGKYQLAKEHYELSLRIGLQSETKDLIVIAESFVRLGEMYMVNGCFAETLRLLEESNRICKKHLPEDHVQNAFYLAVLGRVYTAQADMKNSKEPLEKSLEIRQKILGKNHPLIADSYLKLGEYYILVNDFKYGLEICEKALEVQKVCFRDKNHYDVMATYQAVGKFHFLLGDLLEAKESFEKSLKIMIELFDEDHPLIGDAYGSLGTVYGACMNHTMHLKYLRKATGIIKKTLGRNHIKAAPHYQSLSLVYLRLGESERAVRKCNKAIEIRTKFYGKIHPLVGEAYLRMSNIYSVKKEIGTAIKYMRISLDISLRFYSSWHLKNILKYKALAVLSENLRDFCTADKYRKVFSAADEKTKGNADISVLDILISKSVDYYDTNSFLS